MKKVFLCFILAAISFSVSAQNKAAERSERVAQMKLELTKPEVKAATAEMTKLYELTPKQADQMAKVQLRKLKNLADIEKVYAVYSVSKLSVREEELYRIIQLPKLKMNL